MDTIEYKGVTIPARTIDIGKGQKVLVPVKVDQHTLYGIPTPSYTDISDKIMALAEKIIESGKSGGNPILAKYIRKGQDGYILQNRSISEDEIEYFIGRGVPYGVVVAFIHGEDLKIGWSKRLEGEISDFGKRNPKEPLSFTKKDAVKVAILRGLVDSLTFRGSAIYTNRNEVVPKAIAKILWPFIERVQRYFKRDASNVQPTRVE